MATETCDTPGAVAQSRYAAEWGLASLIMASVLVLVAVLAFLVILGYLALINQVRPGRTDVKVAAILTSILVGLFWILTVVSIIFSIIGVRAAWRRCQPGGLPLGGMFFSMVAFLLWSAVVVVLVGNIMDLSRRHIL